MRRLLFDLEGNGLLPDLTKLHCIAATDVDTGQPVGAWGPDEIPQGLTVLAMADKLIAHFGLGYDFPALEKVTNFRVPKERQVDTVVLARLKFPNIKELDSKFSKTLIAKSGEGMGDEFGKHSIAAWGIRLGIPKLHTGIEDWSQWTPEMQERCVGDVATALKLWNYIDPDKLSAQAVELEHRTARLCHLITRAGWPFNEKAAGELHAELVTEKAAAEKALIEQFGSWWKNKGEFTPKVNNKARGYVVGQTFTKIERVTFNPSSRQHIEKKLREYGWEPEEFTDSGQAKLDEEVLESVAAEFSQAKGLTRYLMLDKRIGQLADGKQAWLKNVVKGFIHAQYNPIGAITMRAAHFNPNISQVPAAASEFGHECRALFYVPEEYGDELGADMSGLEGRCFAHYLAKYDAGAYGKALLQGDPHWAVVLAVGFLEPGTSRDKLSQLHTIVRETGAKRLFYAMLYGCGDEKAGRIILEACRLARKTNPEWGYVSEHFFGDEQAPNKKLLKKVGSKAKFDVVQGIAGFEQLKRKLRDFASYGSLPGLDNRRIPIRSEHSALNTLLQSAGAILCKQWICDAYDGLIADGLTWGWDGDFVFLGWIHDELQVACRNGLGDRIGQVLTTAAREAGRPFNFRITLDSEYKIGRSWADTH